MADPSTIVTFIDADDDEFPIRVWGEFGKDDRPELIIAARSRLAEFVEEGTLRPKEPITKAHVEI